MKADVAFKTTVDEAALIIEAVQYLYTQQAWNAQVTAATDEEKMAAGQKVLRCESILRQMGAAVPKPATF